MMHTHPSESRPTRKISTFDEATVYQICVEGRLESKWDDWFEGFTLTCEGETTLLTGLAVDQAALYGLFARLRDLNLTILSVQRLK